jgi:hypothetical protein
MLKRYKSVRTFKTTVTKISIFEMAGWQKSGGFHVISVWEYEDYPWDLLPGSG